MKTMLVAVAVAVAVFIGQPAQAQIKSDSTQTTETQKKTSLRAGEGKKLATILNEGCPTPKNGNGSTAKTEQTKPTQVGTTTVPKSPTAGKDVTVAKKPDFKQDYFWRNIKFKLFPGYDPKDPSSVPGTVLGGKF